MARAPEYLEHTSGVKPIGEAVSLVKWASSEVPAGPQRSPEHSGLPAAAETFDLVQALGNGWDRHFIQIREAVGVPVPAQDVCLDKPIGTTDTSGSD